MKLDQAGRSLVSRITTSNNSTTKKCVYVYPAGQQSLPSALHVHVVMHGRDTSRTTSFYRWHTHVLAHVLQYTYKTTEKLDARQENLCRFSRIIVGELLASLVGDGREEQCASSEAPVKLPQRQSRPGRDMASQSVWPLMHACMAVQGRRRGSQILVLTGTACYTFKYKMKLF